MIYELSFVNYEFMFGQLGGGNSGVIPGSFQDYFKIIPGSFRDHSRVILGSFRGPSSRCWVLGVRCWSVGCSLLCSGRYMFCFVRCLAIMCWCSATCSTLTFVLVGLTVFVTNPDLSVCLGPSLYPQTVLALWGSGGA